MYQKLDVYEGDIAEDPMDVAGYTGQFNRKKFQLEPISDAEFIALFVKDDRMKNIQHIIRTIDKDRNGYITQTELDDILKEVYPELRTRELLRLIRPFCSVSNKILVDYGKFRSFVSDFVQNVAQKDGNTPKESKLDVAKSNGRIVPNSVIHVKDLFKQRRGTTQPRSKLGQALAATLNLRKTKDLLDKSLDEDVIS